MDVWLLALELTVPIVFLLGALYLLWMADWRSGRIVISKKCSRGFV